MCTRSLSCTLGSCAPTLTHPFALSILPPSRHSRSPSLSLSLAGCSLDEVDTALAPLLNYIEEQAEASSETAEEWMLNKRVEVGSEGAVGHEDLPPIN